MRSAAENECKTVFNSDCETVFNDVFRITIFYCTANDYLLQKILFVSKTISSFTKVVFLIMNSWLLLFITCILLLKTWNCMSPLGILNVKIDFVVESVRKL